MAPRGEPEKGCQRGGGLCPQDAWPDGDGHVVNTASFIGVFAAPINTIGYHVSKYAVAGLSEALALEFEPGDVGVTRLCARNVSQAGLQPRASP
ncbi:MAG TPA: SDR family NAD(P)-dependent oxidoreductase [Dehalococcoidia bacterium]|nr:SDR family NAD(P)-dependent oxidoreductase [Dehalococcoidia bacterium]